MNTMPMIRRANAVMLLLLMSVLLLPLTAVTARAEGAHTATPITFSVQLTPDDPTTYTVVGWLNSPGPTQGRTLHLLLSGATYNHTYWDFPHRSAKYSYVQTLHRAGYATLNLDRLGVGQSDRPRGASLTPTSDAYVVHQIVQHLRADPTYGFSRILLVGHSLGSAIAIAEAAAYQDVDGVVLTGFLHSNGPDVPAFVANVYPAAEDPAFANRMLPSGYFTTRPGQRGQSFFYYRWTTDPIIVARDEATKDTVTEGELGSFAEVVSSTQSRNIRVPVLSLIGQYDTLFCTPPICAEAAQEAAFFDAATPFELQIIPSTGHILNLHRTAPSTFNRIRVWADTYFGPTITE